MTYAPMRARGAQSYARVGLETGVNSASPEKLITLLFDGARSAIRRAQVAMEAGDVAARGQAISKALEIVGSGLRAALNREAGGEVAENLYQLYEYIERCLLQANLRADADKLAEADTLLKEVADAWKEMSLTRQQAALQPEATASAG